MEKNEPKFEGSTDYLVACVWLTTSPIWISFSFAYQKKNVSQLIAV